MSCFAAWQHPSLPSCEEKVRKRNTGPPCAKVSWSKTLNGSKSPSRPHSIHSTVLLTELLPTSVLLGVVSISLGFFCLHAQAQSQAESQDYLYLYPISTGSCPAPLRGLCWCFSLHNQSKPVVE